MIPKIKLILTYSNYKNQVFFREDYFSFVGEKKELKSLDKTKFHRINQMLRDLIFHVMNLKGERFCKYTNSSIQSHMRNAFDWS